MAEPPSACRGGSAFSSIAGVTREKMEAMGAHDEARRFRAERRLAQEHIEADADMLARQRRSLGDVARELQANRTPVRAKVGSRAFAGLVVHTGDDLLTLVDAGIQIDLCLPAVTELQVLDEESLAHGAASAPSQPKTLVGRLNEFHAIERVVELGGAQLETTPPSTIEVVAIDHVEIATPHGGRFIPLQAVTYIISRQDQAGHRAPR